MPNSDNILGFSASLLGGGVTGGELSAHSFVYFEQASQSSNIRPMNELFPELISGHSVNMISACMFGLGRSAIEYFDRFQESKKLLSSSDIEDPSKQALYRSMRSWAAKQFLDKTPPFLQRGLGLVNGKLLESILYTAENPLMDTEGFSAALSEYFNGYTLADLNQNTVLTAGLVTSDLRHIATEFSRVSLPNNEIQYSSPNHKDILLSDIILGGIGIPGFMRGHHIPQTGQLFNDNGHVADFANPAIDVRRLTKTKYKPAHVLIGHIAFPLPSHFVDPQNYNKLGVASHLADMVYKATTCHATFTTQLRTLRREFGDANVFDLSAYPDPKTHPPEAIPHTDQLLTSDDQSERIKNLFEFESGHLRRKDYERVKSLLHENAEAVIEDRIQSGLHSAHEFADNIMGRDDEASNIVDFRPSPNVISAVAP